MKTITSHLTALYGKSAGRAASLRLRKLLAGYRGRIPAPRSAELSERDAILITYPDQVREPDSPPLRSLAGFCERRLAGLISGIHLLPFFPSSSDDGFSVTDYRAVDPALGGWEDLGRLSRSFRLMFDAVFNHVSVGSEWFRAFLRGEAAYSDYFIVVPEGLDLSQVARPRSSPLLTRFPASGGGKKVWTTFSSDQADLNYANPAVLLEAIDTLLYYARQGAEFIRLDAVAYLWKEIGTSCIHLPQTHRLIRIFRAVLDLAAPHLALVTETNVAHAENVSYFGHGNDEAQLVYNFALPPLVLHAFHSGEAGILSGWAAGLATPSRRTFFLNFLASHDGIGLNPVHGILSAGQLEALVECTLAHGGLVSFRSHPDGKERPYELNINFFDALSDPRDREPIEKSVDRFIASQAIMLALAGVPGIYFHSLFGSRGWSRGVGISGQNRAINRERCDRVRLEDELDRPDSLRRLVFDRYRRLLRVRAAHPAFNPQGGQRVIITDPAVFALLRLAPRGDEQVLCMHNVSGEERTFSLHLRETFGFSPDSLEDLVSGRKEAAGARRTFHLRPYQIIWIKPGTGQ